MKTKMIVKSLGLAVAVAASAAAFADYGSPRYDMPRYDTPRYDAPRYETPRYDMPRPAHPVPPANVVVVPAHAPVIAPQPPMFQETLRMMNEIDERQDRQQDRILSGLYERRINPMEFRKLMDEQRAIRLQERQAMADGFLSRTEFQNLNVALENASRNIMREMNDGHGRRGWGHYDHHNWGR